MPTRTRFRSAVSAAALAGMLTACATSGNRVATGFGGQSPTADVGLATKAMVALNSNDLPTAIALAERAVEKTPMDAGFRGLLANAYFAAGRFASAEQAYKDALSLYSNQPQLILKLALVEIALGKKDDAVAFLEAGRSALSSADYGLAMALAGRAADVVPMLEAAAQQRDADARLRQNLALAYALSGDWVNARVVAAQDVPADQIDSHIQQWMQLAGPMKPAQQVGALVGVTPAAADPGQPVRLALVKSETRTAAAAPIEVAPQQPEVSQTTVALPPVQYAPPPVMAMAAPPPAPAPVEVPAPVETMTPPPPPVELEPQPALAAAIAPVAVPAPAAPALVEASAAVPAVAADFPFVEVKKRARAKLKPASAAAERLPVRNAVVRTGKSSAVVQLGAFSSSDRVLVGWNRAMGRYGALKSYRPMSARFDTGHGAVYRLSVKGFGSMSEAMSLCASYKRAGGKCFVRSVAGDRPVQIASR